MLFNFYLPRGIDLTSCIEYTLFNTLLDNYMQGNTMKYVNYLR